MSVKVSSALLIPYSLVGILFLVICSVSCKFLNSLLYTNSSTIRFLVSCKLSPPNMYKIFLLLEWYSVFIKLNLGQCWTAISTQSAHLTASLIFMTPLMSAFSSKNYSGWQVVQLLHLPLILLPELWLFSTLIEKISWIFYDISIKNECWK